MGRPRHKIPRQTACVRFPPHMRVAVESVCDQAGMSLSDVVRMCVKEALPTVSSRLLGRMTEVG